ncbi:glycosyltransferase family 2 protein [Thermocaproicibacter melissae]|uniref:glycosyltransferase family 2 protein n=1 Tax=Thermocaproicibacter melissae TaxID=2966552 RepID=UPI0024B1BA75|nr:glycosyltransferase family 2 protein [Thermocaproicibacter melissae]WBY64618.1 glycosyltransferase [Thermocaproicibacter melissae]
MPLISVIVPVYNVEKYLERCVRSILSQSFSDFELLLVNDGSTDNSLDIAREFCFDSRVRVLDKSHGGLGHTRNYGAAHATGKYLLFVDSDDWIEEDTLRDLSSFAEAYSADLVVFNFTREDTETATKRDCILPLNYPECGMEIREKFLAELIGPDQEDSPWSSVEMLGCAWRRLYLRSWFEENNIQFGDEQKIMLEDLPAVIHAHSASKRLLAVRGTYYHYRYNPNSLSTRYRPRKMEMLTLCFETVKEILKEYDIYEQYEERHLAWFLRFAAHSSLVNCFNPQNPANFAGRWREVRGILQNPILRRAAKSNYLLHGSRADRTILRILRLRFTPLVYLFYKFYVSHLRKQTDKK